MITCNLGHLYSVSTCSIPLPRLHLEDGLQEPTTPLDLSKQNGSQNIIDLFFFFFIKHILSNSIQGENFGHCLSIPIQDVQKCNCLCARL